MSYAPLKLGDKEAKHVGDTKIEWADLVWNPVTGCTPVSEGCQNCYAQRMAYRLRGRYGYPSDDPFRVTIHSERLDEPYTWRKPRRVFVCSMSDLFHDGVPDDFILRVFEVVLDNPEHIFMVLTKRPQRMKEFIERLGWIALEDDEEEWWPAEAHLDDSGEKRVLKNLWFGVTVENQARAYERIPLLLQIPAAGYFVSYEPGLGPVDLWPWLRPSESSIDYAQRVGYDRVELGLKGRLDWVIAGGETGPGARPMHPDWVRSLRYQCQEASVPFFFKSWGEWAPWYGCEDEGCPCGREHEEEECSRVRFWGYSSTGGPSGYEPRGVVCSVRVGRKAAGRVLDGRTWDEFPQ